ncbi:unnamed protein product [Caenorhabditis auriculariae]|uniref:Integrator complex subunit 1 R4 domain-containing protein n=1 Tax=Caenorhabditis auriculariae TaxID=2777116 RepID=A0A8S1GP98_9PELO|nr:unnamed protein product [Caenorhabditis auriculariae]
MRIPKPANFTPTKWRFPGLLAMFTASSSQMTDIDEREGRTPSFSHQRHLASNEWQNWQGSQANKEADNLAFGKFDYSPKMTDSETLDFIRKLERSLRAHHNKTAKMPKIVAKLFLHPNSSVRKCAFSCAVLILANVATKPEQILEAYRIALCCSNGDIAENALSFLPQFVKVCPEQAWNLNKFGIAGHERISFPSTEMEKHIAMANQSSMR